MAGLNMNMSTRLTALTGCLLAALLAASTLPGVSVAQAHLTPCGERRTIIEQLEKRYQEKRVAVALAADGRMIEVFVGPLGSWTLIKSAPSGVSCVMDSGEAWRPVSAPQDEPLA